MKIGHLKALASFLNAKEKKADPFLVVAQDDFDRKQAFELIIHAFQIKPNAIVHLSAEGMTQERLSEELSQSSLFSLLTLVRIEGVERLNSAAMQVLVRYCAQPSSSHLLVMEASELPASSPLMAAVNGQGCVCMFSLTAPWERERVFIEWLKEEATRRQVQIEQKAAERLVQCIGADKRLLIQELEKCISYTGKKAISPSAVAAVAVGVSYEVVWELAQVVQQRLTAQALRIWKGLCTQQVEPLAMLGALRHQLQLGYRLCSLATQGATKETMKHQAPQLSEKALDKNLKMAQQYGQKAFRYALLEIEKVERLLKSDSSSSEVAMQMLLVRLSKEALCPS